MRQPALESTFSHQAVSIHLDMGVQVGPGPIACAPAVPCGIDYPSVPDLWPFLTAKSRAGVNRLNWLSCQSEKRAWRKSIESAQTGRGKLSVGQFFLESPRCDPIGRSYAYTQGGSAT